VTARRLLLSAAFLGGAVLLAAGGAARAQDMRFRPASPGSHQLSGRQLTADEVKRALDALSPRNDFPSDLPRELQDLLKQQGRTKDGNLDEKQIERLLEQIQKSPLLKKQFDEELARRGAQSKASPPVGGDHAKLLELLKKLPKSQSGGPGNGFEAPPIPNGGTPPDPRKATPPNDTKGTRITPPPFNNDNPRNGGEQPGGKTDDFPAPPDRPPTPPDGNPFPPFNEGQEAPPSPFDLTETPRERSMRTFAELWERNIGPLDDTPAVKRALFDLVDGTADLKDAQGNSLWDTFGKGSGDSAWADLFDDAALGGNWNMPKFDLPSFDWGRSRADLGGRSSNWPDSGRDSWWSRSPSSGSRGGSWDMGSFNIPGLGVEVGWLPVVILAAIVVAILVWRFWPAKGDPGSGLNLGALHGWPIDPRTISTRQHVVIAFEYLSVLICGPSAKTWTHTTIAQALGELATTQLETATMLARLYELARYAPLEEPLTADEVTEARRLVCRLAGLEHE
jgi:hypothetical protein